MRLRASLRERATSEEQVYRLLFTTSPSSVRCVSVESTSPPMRRRLHAFRRARLGDYAIAALVEVGGNDPPSKHTPTRCQRGGNAYLNTMSRPSGVTQEYPPENAQSRPLNKLGQVRASSFRIAPRLADQGETYRFRSLM